MNAAFLAQFYQWFKSSANGNRYWLLYSFSPLSHLPRRSAVCYSYLPWLSSPLGSTLRLPKGQGGLEVVVSCTVTFFRPSAFFLPWFGNCSPATCTTVGQKLSHLLPAPLDPLWPAQHCCLRTRITQVWFSSPESRSPSRLELSSLSPDRVSISSQHFLFSLRSLIFAL